MGQATAPHGTPLAGHESSDVSPLPPFVALRSANLRLVASQISRRVAPKILVFGAAVVTVLWLAGYPAPRVYALAAIYAGSALFQLAVVARACKGVADESTLVAKHLVVITLQAVCFGLTGGLASPLVPGILGPSIGTMVAFGKSWRSLVTVTYATAITAVLALLPTSWTGAPPAYPYNVILTLLAIVLGLFMLYASVTRVIDAYVRAGETLERMRENVCQSSIARTKSLEAIGSKVAHELKNPLAAIKGLVQLLERSQCDEKSRERLTVIAHEVTRMEAILKDYLSFSRPLEDLRPEPLDMGALVDEVITVLEARAEIARVTLARKGEGGSVHGDARRLKEALMNLVSNAIEATPPNGSVTVEVKRAPSGVEVVVSDTGRGIPVDQLPRIGTPFFTTREGGTGLGVVLARAVVQHHGGDVHYDSTAGRGTTVTVTLPAKPRRTSDGEAAGRR